MPFMIFLCVKSHYSVAFNTVSYLEPVNNDRNNKEENLKPAEGVAELNFDSLEN